MANHLTRIVVGMVLLAIPTAAWAQDAPRGVALVPVDPTENVKALVLLESRRQDDARKAEALRQDGLREASDKYNAAAIGSIKALFDAEVKNTQVIIALRSDADEKLRIAESKRIDAIRAVDVNAVAVASQKADQQANTLAASVTSSAEALRKSQADSAERLANQITTTAATQLQNQQQQFAGVTALISGLSTRITTLEQAGATLSGKAGVDNPAFTALLAEVKALREAQREGAGKSEGISSTVAILMSALGLLLVMLGIGVTALVRRAPAK